MRLFQRARSSYALSLILCAVLLGAMAVPAFADKGEARSNRAEQAEEAQAKKAKKAKDKKEAERAEAAAKSSSSNSSNASSKGQSASAAKSSNASSKGQSASAAKSSNASSKGQSASAAKSSNASANASAKSKGQSSAATKSNNGDKPATAAKQDSGEEKAAGENSPAGNKGSMKVRPVGTAPHPPRNYAHLPCVVQVDFYGSPHSGATLTAVSHAPTAPTGQTLLTETMTFSQPSPNPRGNELVGTTTLDFTSAVSGLTYHDQQGYHVKLTAVQDGPQGGDVKHKVFWIDCPPPAAPAEDAEVGSTGESLEENDTATADVAAQVEVEGVESAEVQGLSGEELTEVRGVTVERQAVAAVEGRVLGQSGAAAAVAGNSRALAATGLGVLTLALLGLFGLGGGAEMLRRFKKR